MNSKEHTTSKNEESQSAAQKQFVVQEILD